MSTTLIRHVAEGDIARFALAPRLGSREFESIRRHLEAGCEPCSRRLAACRRAGGEITLPVVLTGGWIVPRRIESIAPKRAGVLADYELVCGAGGYELDVIVREIESPQRLDIGGQVTRAAALHEPARDVPLFLLDAGSDGVVSETSTDEFGEFDFSASSGSRYGLRVGDKSDSPCVLVWDGVR